MAKFVDVTLRSIKGTPLTYDELDTNFGNLQRATAPIGGIIIYAGVDTPAGWFICNGGTLFTADFPDLFNVLGYTFGGSGTSFKIPDLRGMFVRGHESGRVFGSVQQDSVKNHTHTISGGDVGSGDLFVTGGTGFGSSGGVQYGSTNSGGGGDETRPKNVALNYIIKAI
jgi:hypothetical protein